MFWNSFYFLSKLDLQKLQIIENSAFESCTSLNNINFPKLEKVGSRSFYGTNISSCNLKSLQNIGDSAFENCKSLNSLIAPKLTSIGNRAFADTNLFGSLDFPELLSIDNESFINNTNLNIKYQHLVYNHWAMEHSQGVHQLMK